MVTLPAVGEAADFWIKSLRMARLFMAAPASSDAGISRAFGEAERRSDDHRQVDLESVRIGSSRMQGGISRDRPPLLEASSGEGKGRSIDEWTGLAAGMRGGDGLFSRLISV